MSRVVSSSYRMLLRMLLQNRSLTRKGLERKRLVHWRCSPSLSASEMPGCDSAVRIGRVGMGPCPLHRLPTCLSAQCWASTPRARHPRGRTATTRSRPWLRSTTGRSRCSCPTLERSIHLHVMWRAVQAARNRRRQRVSLETGMCASSCRLVPGHRHTLRGSTPCNSRL
eukprot:365576-Chlamydomonas_euryale.AAC.12